MTCYEVFNGPDPPAFLQPVPNGSNDSGSAYVRIEEWLTRRLCLLTQRYIIGLGILLPM